MSAPTKVNSDVPLIDLKKIEAAKPPQPQLVLKVHDSLESMAEAMGQPIKREKAFSSADEVREMVKK